MYEVHIPLKEALGYYHNFYVNHHHYFLQNLCVCIDDGLHYHLHFHPTV